MPEADSPSQRDARGLKTKERLLGAAIAEFKRFGMADADVGAIVSAAGVAHGTFFYYFSTKEHVLLELEIREEERLVKLFGRFLGTDRSMTEVLKEAARLVVGLERRLGSLLFKDFLVLHFSGTRPPLADGGDHPMIVMLAEQIERARLSGRLDVNVDSTNSAIFFLLGLYALLLATFDWPTSSSLVDDYVIRTIRSLDPPYVPKATSRRRKSDVVP